MIEAAKTHGRKYLGDYANGIIGEIIGDLSMTTREKVAEISSTLLDMRLARDCESLPWDVTDTKKVPAPTGTEGMGEDTQVDYTTRPQGIAPLVDRVWAMEVLRSEG